MDKQDLKLDEQRGLEEIEDTGYIFDIQKYSINDGPGIRTTVFFKGCPLKCLWCDNPESQEIYPQMLYLDTTCARCYRCVEVCSTGATSIADDGALAIDRDRCTACGKCVEVCTQEARAISGRLVKVNELVEAVRKDGLFYRNSGGGVTASGGEATYQPKFLKAFFKRCQELGLHTALDTCGYVRWPTLEDILQYVDLVLFDIKHMDPEIHRELTGFRNELVLENAERIAQKGQAIIIRVPIIPGYNDSLENVDALAKFVLRIGVNRVDLLPYHQLGTKKYQRLGMSYSLAETRLFKEEEVQAIKEHLESYGLIVTVS